MAWNTAHTRYKSSLLEDVDCRTTGATRTPVSTGWQSFTAVVTLDEILEAGDCIAMVRVPRGFTVTDVDLMWTAAGSNAVIGVGDPFCCGRFVGPCLTTLASGNFSTAPQGTSCAHTGRLMKIGRTGDGCGKGYTYTCETDLIVTNGYGDLSFAVGGGAPGTAVSGPNGGTLQSGMVIGLTVEGFVNPEFTNLT